MPTVNDEVRTAIIADLKKVQAFSGNPVPVTRNYYRHHGMYTEHEWQYYFPTFKDFLKAASIDPEPEAYHKPYEFVNNNYLDVPVARYHDYFQVSDLATQTELNPSSSGDSQGSLLNLSNSKAGDFFAIGPKLYQVTGRNGTAVYSRRYRWYNRLHDWLRA